MHLFTYLLSTYLFTILFSYSTLDYALTFITFTYMHIYIFPHLFYSYIYLFTHFPIFLQTYPGMTIFCSSSSFPSSSSTLYSPARPSRKAWRRVSAADLLASYFWRETALGVSSGFEDARLVLDQFALAREKVLACLMGAVLTGVRGHTVAVIRKAAEGFIIAQLSRCLCGKI